MTDPAIKVAGINGFGFLSKYGMMKSVVMRKCVIVMMLVVLGVAGCNAVREEQTRAGESGLAAVYEFLFDKLAEDDIDLIASGNDENIRLIEEIIKENEWPLRVERYGNIERDSSMCYYSKRTKKLVAVVSVTKRGANTYYVSYYLGPEGGASKEIEIEERDGAWAVVNDDGRWAVK
jgi:hypothetical protein